MVEVLYTYLINEGLGEECFYRLLHLVGAIPDSIFYGDDNRLVRNTDIAFNNRLQADLEKALGDTLQIAATITLADLYSYKVDGMIALFKTIDSEWYCCLFVPYRESELKIFDEKMPRRYIIDEISARIGHYLKSADIDNCFIIGYKDPRESQWKGVHHV